MELRRASADASVQFGRSFAYSAPKKGVPRPIVEAFPNAFLGVLTPEEELLSAPKLRRGGRFDWLYERIVTTGRLKSVLAKRLDLPGEIWHRLSFEKDHELRSALVCLLTAALAAQGTAAVIGEATGGWFWLPPLSLWQPWAIQGLNSAAKTMAMKGQSLDEFRCD